MAYRLNRKNLQKMNLRPSDYWPIVIAAEVLHMTRSGIHWLIRKKKLRAIVIYKTPKGRKIQMVHRMDVLNYTRRNLDRRKSVRYSGNSKKKK